MVCNPDVVIDEKIDMRYLYRIISGSVILRTGTRDLFPVKDGDFFGEITFLTGTTGSVYEAVVKEPTKLSVIEPYYLSILFQHYPNMAGKFYSSLAVRLCDRLNTLQVGYI